MVTSALPFQIKGLSWSESKAQANRYMVDLKIEVKANTKSSQLSGTIEYFEKGSRIVKMTEKR